MLDRFLCLLKIVLTVISTTALLQLWCCVCISSHFCISSDRTLWVGWERVELFCPPAHPFVEECFVVLFCLGIGLVSRLLICAIFCANA